MTVFGNTYVNVIKNIYNYSKVRVKIEFLGDSFPINKGVRQGDPLTPKLFSEVLEQMFRKFECNQLGLNINGSRLTHLRFADDLVIFEENPGILEIMVQTLADKSLEVGL